MAKAAHLEGIVRCMLLGNMSHELPFLKGHLEIYKTKNENLKKVKKKCALFSKNLIC